MDIKRLFKLICDEWERTIMTVVMLSLLVFLSVTAYNMLMEDEGSSQNNVKPKAPHHFFDTTSTSYIEPARLPSSINPFNFHIKVALPTPPKHNPQPVKPQQGGKNNNTPRPPDKTPPKDDGKKPAPEVVKPQPKQEPSKPQPPKVVRKISIQYRGYLRGTTDEQIAFYSALDSKSKKTEAKSAKEGAKIHGLLPIKSFDADQLVVVQGGKDVIVKRGKKQEIIIP